jgi:hypothetical protein
MTYKQFIKDLFFGLVIGSVLVVGINLLVRPFSVGLENKNEELKIQVAKLERDVSHLKGENASYKRWVDSMMCSLTVEQKLDLMKKM